MKLATYKAKKNIWKEKKMEEGNSKISILHFHIIRQLCIDICLGKKT